MDVVLETMARVDEQNRARSRAEQAADKAPKLPSERFMFAHRKWLIIAGVDAEEDLPQIYHDLANVLKGDLRPCLQGHLDERASQEGAATPIKTLVTVNCYEAVKMGDLGRHHDIDDLTAGIQPFSCGYDAGPKTATIAAAIQGFDLMQSGSVNPTMSEQQEFMTKTVRFPRDPFEFTQMLGSTSLFLDVLQGTHHPHAYEFRTFVRRDVPEILSSMSNMDTATADMWGNIYPSLMRGIQVKMTGYWGDLLNGRNPEVPNYGTIRSLVQGRSFGLLPPIPRSYFAGTPATPAPLPPYASGPTGGGAAGASRGLDLGQSIANSTPTNRGWITVFTRSSKTVAELRSDAPRDANGQELCLKYHLEGRCWSNCERRSSHCLLVGSTRTQFQSFVDRHLSPRPSPATETGRGRRQDIPPSGGGGTPTPSGGASS
jgi:hypothetical protein